jgi:hypothetical protein
LAPTQRCPETGVWLLNTKSSFAGEIRALRFPATKLGKIADALDLAVWFLGLAAGAGGVDVQGGKQPQGAHSLPASVLAWRNGREEGRHRGRRGGAVAAGWLVLRAEFRVRWRTWLTLCLIAGLFAGVVQAAAAGARRTDSAYPSLVVWSHPPDALLFSFPGQSGTFGKFSMAAVARLPQVTQFATVASYTVANPANVSIWAPETDAVPGRFWHRKILAGRTADPARRRGQHLVHPGRGVESGSRRHPAGRPAG